MVCDLTNSYCSKEADSSICLIKNKADVNACNNQGRSPAHFTVQFELYSVLNAVLEAGASLNEQVRNGKAQTPRIGIYMYHQYATHHFSLNAYLHSENNSYFRTLKETPRYILPLQREVTGPSIFF